MRTESSPLHEALQVLGNFLRRDLDARRLDAGPQCALGLEAAARIDLETLGIEDAQHSGCRQGFHRESSDQPTGRGEREHAVRGGLELPLIVDVGGRTESFPDRLDLGFIEKTHRMGLLARTR